MDEDTVKMLLSSTGGKKNISKSSEILRFLLLFITKQGNNLTDSEIALLNKVVEELLERSKLERKIRYIKLWGGYGMFALHFIAAITLIALGIPEGLYLAIPGSGIAGVTHFITKT